jgi:hypothetical protein
MAGLLAVVNLRDDTAPNVLEDGVSNLVRYASAQLEAGTREELQETLARQPLRFEVRREHRDERGGLPAWSRCAS